jgi:hypothetical protein
LSHAHHRFSCAHHRFLQVRLLTLNTHARAHALAQVFELRAKSAAENDVMVESCEKRMRILEYDLLSKVEEIKNFEKVWLV